MNKDIKTLVDLYFSYRPTKDPELITEEYHIASEYFKVARTIQKLYQLHKNDKIDKESQLIYTGYNLNIDTQKLSKLNNEFKYIPIYAELIYSSDKSVYTAVVDKDKSTNKIIVQINVNFIKSNEYILLGSLQHELLHVREMYAKPDINVLKSFKNRIPENEQNKFIHLLNTDFDIIMKICYIFNKAEERARVNAVHMYTLKNMKVYKKTKQNNLCQYFIEQTNKLSNLTDMKTYIDKVDMRGGNYLFVEALTYYMNMFNLTKCKFNVYHFNSKPNELMKLYFDDSDEYDKTFDQILSDLNNNFNEFYKNLKNTIYFASTK